MDPTVPAREFYRAVDDDAYETLADLLAPEFVHDRPDRTIEGREAFVRFMRDDRPVTDTTHALDAVYVREEAASGGDEEEATEVAVRGRLLRGDGSEWFGFVDVFAVEAGRATHLTTYTH